ncbi:hypothetical protein Mame01_37190 [Microbispora amethystogenes]|nr:hypothetical protein Mame01_37190 [Microbispora amethystogenes]
MSSAGCSRVPATIRRIAAVRRSRRGRATGYRAFTTISPLWIARPAGSPPRAAREPNPLALLLHAFDFTRCYFTLRRAPRRIWEGRRGTSPADTAAWRIFAP